MADDYDGVVSMLTNLAEEQNGEWETYLKAYVEERRPADFTLSGAPAADYVQPELDAFFKDVDTKFDDNLDLGMTLHKVMVGLRQIIVETDERAAGEKKTDG